MGLFHTCSHAACEATAQILVQRIRDLESELDRLREFHDQSATQHQGQVQQLFDRLLSFAQPGWAGIPHPVPAPSAITEAMLRRQVEMEAEAGIAEAASRSGHVATGRVDTSRPVYQSQPTPLRRTGFRPRPRPVPGSSPVLTPDQAGFNLDRQVPDPPAKDTAPTPLSELERVLEEDAAEVAAESAEASGD
jgi:hypothetical protein